MRLLIAGTPCTGKTTLAQKLSRELDCALVDANDLVEQLGCYKLDKKDGSKQVDLKVLQRHLKELLEDFGKRRGSVIVEGHLLCDMNLPCEKLVVLRCDPLVLEKRMKKRRWKKEKISENLLTEILDYCLVNSEENYGKKVVQLDFTTPLSVEKTLKKIASGKGDKVDWSNQLLSGKLAIR